jgi:hypothetical protein
MNNPLNTIFKPENKSKLKTLLGTQTQTQTQTQIRLFPNNKINRIQVRYQTVFSKIMSIFTKSKFYNDVFLPRMKQRRQFMRINNKILGKKNELLTQRQYKSLAKQIGNSRTYEQYMNNKETPVFTYITNDRDQFENWSAIRIFEWWRSLRTSGIPKREWRILDAVKYLFINQFMRIMNSYLKYGVDKRDKLAFDELKEYLRLVDVFYESRGQYQYLLDAHLAFCEWFSARFIGGLLFESGRNNNKEYVSSSIYYNKKRNNITAFKYEHIISYIILSFKKTFEEENNGILFIPLSFFQKEPNFINTYTAPLIVFLGINYRTHVKNNFFSLVYTPIQQLDHDFIIHSKSCKSSYEQLYPRTNYDDIKLFEQRCKFLTIVSSIDNDNCKKLLWLILHEISFFEEHVEEILNRTTIESTTFFDFNVLFERLNNLEIQLLLKKYLTLEQENSEILKLDSIYTLICACIVYFMSNFLPLEYFKDLKIIIESIVFINNKNNISNKLIKILRKEKLLIEFEYNVKTKQLKLRLISDSNLLKCILELQSKGVLLIHYPYCFESYLLSPNTIQAYNILSDCVFFNLEFLPKMRERVAKNRVIMRVDNKKFSKLSEVDFRTKRFELGITTNSFNKYQERYDTSLFTYIYEDKAQFENWSAIRIFEWWRNLRMSGTKFSTFTQKIQKREWPVLDAVKYLFINQILHILNSYLKYGITDESHLAFTELQKYLRIVDVFYESGGQYQHLLNAHLAFCEWFSERFIGGLLFERSREHFVNSKVYNNRSKNYKNFREIAIKQLIEMFAQSLNDKNYILVIPLSYFQKESKIINEYSAPIIPFLGINYRTHEDIEVYYLNYSPKNQITHDFAYHSRLICSSYSLLYPNENYSDIMLFLHRCKFLTIVSLINNDEFKKLLWYILHEIFFFNETEINFFNFNILFQKLNEQETYKILQLVFNDKIKLTQSIYTLICACIIFFMFQSFSLNGISQISIKINQYITTVSLNDKQLVILEINSMTKQVKIIYLNKDIINQKNESSFSYIIQQSGWSIVDSQPNTQQQIKMYEKQIGNLYKKMLELQQAQP